MSAPTQALRIAYVHFGAQSGVTDAVLRALRDRGHHVEPVLAAGPLEPRDERGRLRPSIPFVRHLACAALRFGPTARAHRWNTPYAFDMHSGRAGALLDRLHPAPDVVLQNGALFAPGLLPSLPYVLLLDHTRALSMRALPMPGAGLRRPVDYGSSWHLRERALYRGARAIGTFSRGVTDSLASDYGVAAARARVVGAGANVVPPSPKGPSPSRTIIFVGKDFTRKGGPVLVRAFERLRRRDASLRLLVAGPRERLALPSGAEHVGFVPTQRLAETMARGAVFALPTLREPFGIAFLDAMGCGLPCVGTRVEAVPEIVDDGATGLLVPPGDDAALAEAIGTLLADPARARAMGAAGRRRVEERFLWSHVGWRLDGLLQEAAAANPLTALDFLHRCPA